MSNLARNNAIVNSTNKPSRIGVAYEDSTDECPVCGSTDEHPIADAGPDAIMHECSDPQCREVWYEYNDVDPDDDFRRNR